MNFMSGSLTYIQIGVMALTLGLYAGGIIDEETRNGILSVFGLGTVATMRRAVGNVEIQVRRAGVTLVASTIANERRYSQSERKE
jgi:hypothetical protein